MQLSIVPVRYQTARCWRQNETQRQGKRRPTGKERGKEEKKGESPEYKDAESLRARTKMERKHLRRRSKSRFKRWSPMGWNWLSKGSTSCWSLCCFTHLAWNKLPLGQTRWRRTLEPQAWGNRSEKQGQRWPPYWESFKARLFSMVRILRIFLGYPQQVDHKLN